jgi:carboxylate-amine ligase
MDAELADLATGERTPARACLATLVEELAPVGARLGCAAELADAPRLAADGGAARQRAAAAAGGDLRAVAAWLADAYAPDAD